MLDANTDRSYFMIGAIIVGAALIAGALFIFREQLFMGENAYIPALLKSVFTEAEKGITGIGSGTIVPMVKGAFGSIFH